MIGRETFTAADLEAMAAAIGLPLARPAWSVVGILNGTIWHYAPTISKDADTELEREHRREMAAAERRVLSAMRRAQSSLRSFTDDLSIRTAELAKIRETDADITLRRLKLPPGSTRMGEHDMRDLLGGALPAAFDLIFGGGSIKQRDGFVARVCASVELCAEPHAIKKAVSRFKVAHQSGATLNLPGWMPRRMGT